MARCLIGMRISGTLATLSSAFTSELEALDKDQQYKQNEEKTQNEESKIQLQAEDHQPIWGCIMPYVLKGSSPILALHPNETHSVNIRAKNSASLTVYALTPKYITPQSVPLHRLVLSGSLEKYTDPANIQLAKLLYREAHPGSVGYLEDYDYYFLKPESIHYYYEGLKLEFLDVEKFKETEVDIMTGDARKLIEILNVKHKEDVANMCSHYASLSADDSFIFHIDRFGFNVAAKTTEYEQDAEGATKAMPKWSQIRFPFPYRMHTIEELVDGLLQAFENCKNEIRKNK